jgi:hypothetical protein
LFRIYAAYILINIFSLHIANKTINSEIFASFAIFLFKKYLHTYVCVFVCVRINASTCAHVLYSCKKRRTHSHKYSFMQYSCCNREYVIRSNVQRIFIGIYRTERIAFIIFFFLKREFSSLIFLIFGQVYLKNGKSDIEIKLNENMSIHMRLFKYVKECRPVYCLIVHF